MKYQLIKEYPDSEPLKTVFTYYKDGWNCYGAKMDNGKVILNTDWKPEYFEPNVGEYFKLVTKTK